MSEHDERAFEDALRIQAVGAGAPTLTLDAVKGRACSIRRRRAAAGATGAAAIVAAAVVPLALLVGGDGSRDALPPADGTPTVSDTANPVPADPVSVDQRGTWVEGDTIHPAEGEPFTPDVDGEVSTVIGLEDGRWVLGAYPDGGAFAIVVTDSTGAVQATYDALDGGLTSDDAGGAVAWIGPDSRPMVLVSGGDEPFRLPAELDGARSPATPLEILPGCIEDDCAVLVEIYDDSPDSSTRYSVSTTGEVLSLDRLGMLSITDVSADGALVAGHVFVDEFGQEYCSGVVVFATGEELWRDCSHGTFVFSPDGTAVLGIDAGAEGFGFGTVIVLDALDGSPIGILQEGTFFDAAWAADGQFLVSLQRSDDGANQLLAVSRDGERRRVVAEREGVAGDPSPLRLTGR